MDRLLPILSGVTDQPAVEPGAVRPVDGIDAAPDAGDSDGGGEGDRDGAANTAPGMHRATRVVDEAAAADAADDTPVIHPAATTDRTAVIDVPVVAKTSGALDATAVLATVSAPAAGWPSEQPDPTDPDGPPTLEDLEAASLPRHRRQPWALLTVSILLALTLGLATYLLLTTRAYERRGAAWESAARTTGAQLTQTRADLDGTVSELAATRDQLSTAQARITQLADEKAQLGDDSALQRQLADYQSRISTAAGNVATALNTCIDGQNQLIGYLQNPSAYNPTDLARFEANVTTVCGNATAANATLQRELKK